MGHAQQDATGDLRCRAVLPCVSGKLAGEVCEGQAQNEMGECRMDIIKSEISYLGYFDSESYGLTWEVRSGAKPLPTSFPLAMLNA
ncbi:unnamed protein product [Ectocarpus sp. 13 AM-2016]